MIKFISKSEEETLNKAKEFAKTLKKNDVVLLYGDVGAGKTVFSKGVAQGLGIKEEVVSPTYAYLNVYDNYLFHYDCYRLDSGEDAERLGLCDYFMADNICLIEWPMNIEDVLPKKTIKVTVKKVDDITREIIIED